MTRRQVKRFLRRRFHDVAALLLLCCVYRLIDADGPRFWRHRLLVGYDKHLSLLSTYHEEWDFFRHFMTQGKQPFAKTAGGSAGPFDMYLASNGTETKWVLAVPLWMVTAVLSVPLIISCFGLPRQLRVKARGRHLLVLRHAWHTTCRKCGYDLRATPERCPECGTLVEHDAQNSGTGASPVLGARRGK